MMSHDPNGRSHEPDLLELVAELDGFRDLMNERDRRYESRFLAQDEKTSLALTASKEAVLKAESATEKRFEGVNEFRKTLSDQAGTFLSKAEAEARLSSQESRLGLLETASSAGTGRAGGITSTLVALVVVSTLVSGLVFGILTLILKK